MILAVDVGNTHIEIGVFEKNVFVSSWRIATGVHRTEDEVMAFIQQFLQTIDRAPTDIKDIAISSVVPTITQIFSKLADKYFQLEPLIVGHQLELGLEIDYEPKYSVGADRLCNAVAAKTKYGFPAIVVDFGTATTLDVLGDRGEYCGGIITPGLEISAWGLYERATKLPKIPLEFPKNAIGRTTETSIQSGIMFGTVKMIDGLIELVSAELTGSPTVIATGGISPLLAPRSKYVEHVEPSLVLDGLMMIYHLQDNRQALRK
ncbi:MAG: type III pantothenate kinase [Calditrichota bacterium]